MNFHIYRQALSILSKIQSPTTRISIIVKTWRWLAFTYNSGAIFRWFSHHSDYGFLRKCLTDSVVGKNHLEVRDESRNIWCLKYLFSKIASIRISFGLFPQRTEIVKSIIRFCLFLWQGRDMSQNASGLPFLWSSQQTNIKRPSVSWNKDLVTPRQPPCSHHIPPVCVEFRALMS